MKVNDTHGTSNICKSISPGLPDLRRRFGNWFMAKAAPVSSTQDAALVRQHSAKLPQELDQRVSRCMKLEGITNFAECARIALTRWCREIERENGIDAEGRPLR